MHLRKSLDFKPLVVEKKYQFIMQQPNTMTATGSPDNKVHGANMGPTCMSQMGPMNLAIRVDDDWSQGDNSIDTDLVRRAYSTIRTRSIGKSGICIIWLYNNMTKNTRPYI